MSWKTLSLSVFLVALLQVQQILSFAFIQHQNPTVTNGGPVSLDTHNEMHPHPAQPPAAHAHHNFAAMAHVKSHLKVHPHAAYFPVPMPPHSPLHTQNVTDMFYKNCGYSVRHCEWVQPQRTKGFRGKIARTHQQHIKAHEAAEAQDENSKPHMEYTCATTRFVCVGNVEGCVSSKSCAVAMKITESTVQVMGKPATTLVQGVAYLSACDAGEQSGAEMTNRPQMLNAIGFTPYDESGKNLECRLPKASDFKMVHLWRNSEVEEALKNTGHCIPRPNNEVQVQWYDHQVMKAVREWPKVCKSIEKKGEEFSLKTFLETHSPVTVFTDFFQPPFTFADNFKGETSENGMLITGAVSKPLTK